ncbi:hypothetical protein [Niveibacterium terrae]|uniref:hypothetical protein n=1 Tax=Niveibacterium terrae TaxID=3373598 RepID=UPI003A8F6C5B
MKLNAMTWLGLVTASGSFALVVGVFVGQHFAVLGFEEKLNVVQANLALANYSGYRDIAIGIRAGKYRSMICSAEFSATSNLETLSACLADAQCRRSIVGKTREFAPEALGEAPSVIARREKCEAD